MSKVSLAVKYRPNTWEDLTEQTIIKDILGNQIKTNTFQHAYLFTGSAGCGKTTSARIFSSLINKGKGHPIEIDAASNSGVDNIRTIISDSKLKSLESDYKCYIIDECHSLSQGAWQAMLKLLEESPKYSVFILCTTNPEKIPATIMSRVQRYNFNKISTEGIINRLKYILESENITDYTDKSLHLIALKAKGGMRNAITLLDKCLSLSNKLTDEIVIDILGLNIQETYITLLDYLNTKNKNCISIIDDIHNSGQDIRDFIRNFIDFVLEVAKYKIFPNTNIDIVDTDKISSIEYNTTSILSMLFNLYNNIKYDNNSKSIVEVTFLLYCDKNNQN